MAEIIYTRKKAPHDWDTYATGSVKSIIRDLNSGDPEKIAFAQGQIRFSQFLWMNGEGLGGMILTRLLASGIINEIPVDQQ